MTKLIVWVFNSRPDANLARDRLMQRGFEDVQIRMEGGAKAATTAQSKTPTESAAGYKEDHGVAGVIERMFSGLLLETGEVARYAKAMNEGKCVVALHVADDAAVSRAVAVLDEVGGKTAPPTISRDSEPSTVRSGAGSSKLDYEALPEFDSNAIGPGPRIYALPDSPTGWGEATHGGKSSIGGIMNDPGRPGGLMGDAGGLGTDGDRSMLGKGTISPGRGNQG